MAKDKKSRKPDAAGKLRIGDQWNAINIIALSQSNPLKAVAEFVENSIDAEARNVTITRGKERGSFYLKVVDDGTGIRLDRNGQPDFRFVATHICDSVKRRLKESDRTGIQGEFGIGLLSFWTVGEELSISNASSDGHVFQMRMRKGSQDYQVTRRRTLAALKGTELKVWPLLPGLRQLTGERIQRFLASELRDRIRSRNVRIRVVDRSARAEYDVKPRQYSGQLLHGLSDGDATSEETYLELYLNEKNDSNAVGLYRSGTRVLENIAELEAFDREPWTSGCFEGLVDAAYLNLTPGTRQGIILDERLDRLRAELTPVAVRLTEILNEQRRSEEERSNRDILKSIQRSLREAFLALPPEEYNWFDLYGFKATAAPGKPNPRLQQPLSVIGETTSQDPDRSQASPDDSMPRNVSAVWK